jgi:hypothetical protein
LGSKQKSFEMVEKIHIQTFSLLTSEIPDLEQKKWRKTGAFFVQINM